MIIVSKACNVISPLFLPYTIQAILDKDSTTALIYIGLQIGLRSFGLLAREIQAALYQTVKKFA